MKQLLTLILLVTASIFAQAEPNSKTISGILKNAQNEPVPSATVNLISATDSALVSGKTASDNGKFEFKNLADGSYILNISAIGYKKYTSIVFNVNDAHPNIVVPIIFLLSEKNKELQNVVVTAKRPLVEQAIDRTIVNVDAMISSATSNTLEVLERTPGVRVSADGSISLNGTGGVLVLIDGRQTYMSAQDLAAYLKSLPGGLLDKIELMDNPPSKYDAAGGAIINIRLKKNKIQGFTGNATASYSQGSYARHSEAVSLTYRQNKVNIFANVGYTRDADYTNDDYDRRFFIATGAPISSVLLTNKQVFSGDGVSARVGLDYAASPKTTYGIQVSGNHNPKRGILDYTSNSFDAGKQLDSVGMGYVTGGTKRNNWGANANFLHRFNNAGREISAEANYYNYQSYSTQDMQNFMYLPDGTISNSNRFLYIIPSNINIYTGSVDYVHPLKGKASFEAGIKSSYVSNDNLSSYFDIVDNNQLPDYSKSNHFVYKENINAAYVNSKKDWGRIGAQLGIRVENTQATGHQLGNAIVKETSFNRNYTGIFPTAYLSYKLDSTGSNTLVLSLSRRINRPNYYLLNPFFTYQDNYSYSSGNPMLKPQYQNRLELKYQHKQYLGISINYSGFSDVIFTTTQAVGDVFVSKPDNVAKGYMFRLATNLNLPVTKWWTVNVNLLLGHLGLNGNAYTEKLQPTTNVVRLDVYNQFKFNKGWSAELSGYYASRDLNGQNYTAGRYIINGGLQKKILKEKGSIRLSFNDLFHSWIQKDKSVALKQAEAFHTNETDTQRIGLAFTYRFGKDIFARKNKRSNNADDSEQGRVN